MSYDLRIAVKVDGTDIFADIATPEYAHPTYNIGEMFRKCMGWDFNQGEYYKVTDVLSNIQDGIEQLTWNEEKYFQYDSPNGWGSTKNAYEVLISLNECIGEVAETIPHEHLYVAW